MKITEEQMVECLIQHDSQNIKQLFKNWSVDYTLHAKVIADCAKRLFQARKFNDELVNLAELNLCDALRNWVG